MILRTRMRHSLPSPFHNGGMQTNEIAPALARLFSELIDGTSAGGGFDGGFVLNKGDIGLLRSLEKLSPADASRSVNGGATIAAHAQHLRYGLSLMNRWAADGGNPFANEIGRASCRERGEAMVRR